MLNQEQKQAIAVEAPVILVKSVVGSGKTTVLVHKILQLCENVCPRDIVVLSFTRKAAAEIRLRLSEKVEWAHELEYCGTFHSIANQLLRNYFDIAPLGFSSDFSIIEERQQQEILEELCFDHNIRIGKRLFAQFHHTDAQNNVKIIQLQQLYQEHKQQNNIMDFDDLIIHLDSILNTQRINFSWLVIDEFQDTDVLQAQVVKKIIGYGTSLFAVGDPQQTIYSWRGSNSYIFQDFLKLPEANQVNLSLNYRSTATIVDSVKGIMPQESCSIRSYREPGAPISIQKYHDPFQEAVQICSKVKQLGNYEQIAILYRRQIQRSAVVKALQQDKIPFSIQRQVRLNDIPVLEWLYNLLCICFNKKNIFGKRIVFAHKKYGAKGKKREFLKEKIETFLPTLHKQKYICISEHFDLKRFLIPTSATFEQDSRIIQIFLQQIEPLEVSELFCERLRQNILLREYNLEKIMDEIDGCAEKGISLMTLHGSKGLEFDHIFVVGANEGNIPIKKIDNDEEKRLFFVGITRAKETVHISYTTESEAFGVSSQPSRYLKQLNNANWEQDTSLKNLDELNTIVKRSTQKNQQKVRHSKYGDGVVVEENENDIIVAFSQYGQKSFSKAFCNLEFI